MVGFADVVPSSELRANGLGVVVSSAVGSVFGGSGSEAGGLTSEACGLTSEGGPVVPTLAPLAVVLGASVTAGPAGSEG